MNIVPYKVTILTNINKRKIFPLDCAKQPIKVILKTEAQFAVTFYQIS